MSKINGKYNIIGNNNTIKVFNIKKTYHINLILFKITINRNYVVKEVENKEDSIAKMFLLNSISRFHTISDFTIENCTMNPELMDTFYKVAIKLISKYGLGNESWVKYHLSNFCMNAKNQDELLTKLMDEWREPKRNDSRYMMGFRSIYVILRNNLKYIDAFEIMKIRSELKPFFKYYSHPELLA